MSGLKRPTAPNAPLRAAQSFFLSFSSVARRTERAPFGALLPEREYEEPILEALAEAGGTAPSSWVTKAVGERLAERLTPLDRERLASREIRWANRVHFTRLRLVERGFLKKGSRRGIWEITEAGRARVEDRRS